MTLRRLSRSVNIIDGELEEISKVGRTTLLSILDHIAELDRDKLVAADALASLCGWKRLYWRLQVSGEFFDILRCLEEIRGNSGNTEAALDLVDLSSEDGSIAEDPELDKATGLRRRLPIYSTRRYSRTDSDERIGGDVLAETADHLLRLGSDLEGFVSGVKSMPYITVVRKLSYMVAIARAVGIEALETIINLQELCEVVVDLFLENHESSEDVNRGLGGREAKEALTESNLLRERCLQLLSDITMYRPSYLQCKLAVCQGIFELIGIWLNVHEESLMLTATSALVILAYSDKSGKSRQLIVSSLCALDQVIVRLGDALFLSPLLFLCRELTPSFNERDITLECVVVVVGWIVRGLYCEIGRTRLLACQVITDIAAVNGMFIHRYLCRREVEEALMHALHVSTEPSQAIEALKALTAGIRHFNPSPFWSREADFVYHWSVTRRLILGPQMGDVL
eukprot:gene9792-12567_t